MTNSILDSTKKQLGLAADYDVFDLEVITHINTAIMSLNQLGIGPLQGFMIEGADETWDDFFGGTDPMLSPVKSYLFMKVKLAFDPPGTSFHINALQEQIKEIEFRLSVYRDDAIYQAPAPVVITDPDQPVAPLEVNVDGGGADL